MAVERDRFGALARDLRPVWVRHTDDRWYPGLHSQWRQVDGQDGPVWVALVAYYAPAMDGDWTSQWLREVPADGVELRDEEAPVGEPRPE